MSRWGEVRQERTISEDGDEQIAKAIGTVQWITQMTCGLMGNSLKETTDSPHPKCKDSIYLLIAVHQCLKSLFEMNNQSHLTHSSNSPVIRSGKTATGIYIWNPLICTIQHVQRTHRQNSCLHSIRLCKLNLIWQNKDRLKCDRITKCQYDCKIETDYLHGRYVSSGRYSILYAPLNKHLESCHSDFPHLIQLNQGQLS